MTSDSCSNAISKTGRTLVLYLVIPATLASGLIWWPLQTMAAVAAILVVTFSLLRASRSAKFVTVLLVCLLAGYAFLGRGFAYLGAPPVYIGELVLTLALIGCIVNGSLWTPLQSKVAWLLLAFASWCAFRTIPYLPVYGVDALRDAAIWGYGAFAFVMAGLLLRHWSLGDVTRHYSRLVPFFLVWIVIAGAIQRLATDSIPTIGENGGPILQMKPGDTAVHLAGIASFLILGLYRTSPSRSRIWLKEWCIWPLWAAGFLLFGSQSRGGLLSILIALAVVLIVWPRGKWGKLVVVGISGLAFVLLLDLEVDLGVERKVSPQQIVNNLSSIVSGSDMTAFEGTRQWRLNWWQSILNYTVYGQFFWEGKGFGINLADDDGFQADPAHLLRSPHNGHLTILARTGVPGLVLWILLQGALSLGLLRSYLGARREGAEAQAAMIVWILAYWTAFTVNCSFDVYLEGPQGGIWFWAVFGMGLAILAERPSRRRGAAGQAGSLCCHTPSTRAA